MSLVQDIAATYRGPGRVLGRLLAAPVHEGRALAILMGGCAVLFVSRWPALARQAHLEGADLQMLMGAALLGLVFILPLMFYLIAFLVHGVARLVGGQGSAYGARLALFWAFLASAPVLLLYGLVAGFIGAGAALSAVGILWVIVFSWFWIAGMMRAGWGQK